MSWSVEEYEIGQVGGALQWVRVGKGGYAIPLSADFNTPAIDALYFELFAIQIVWTGADATDGEFEIEASLDGANWATYCKSVRVVDAPADNQPWDFDLSGMRFLRVSFTANANTAGTAQIRYLLKTQR